MTGVIALKMAGYEEMKLIECRAGCTCAECFERIVVVSKSLRSVEIRIVCEFIPGDPMHSRCVY